MFKFNGKSFIRTKLKKKQHHIICHYKLVCKKKSVGSKFADFDLKTNLELHTNC